MINTDMLKSFEPDSNTFTIIREINHSSECDSESVRLVLEQVDRSIDQIDIPESINRELVITSGLDIDETGYYKSKLTGYDTPKLTDRQAKTRLTENVIEYTTENNSFEENTGVTIQNVELNSLVGDRIRLAEYGKKLLCGHILDNLFLEFKKEKDNALLIIDFDEIEEVSENFMKSFAKFLLQTSNKVIPINMDLPILNDFNTFMYIYLVSDEDKLEDQLRKEKEEQE